MANIRDYGLGDSTQFVRGIPRVVGVAKGVPACLNCGCETLYDIEVNIEHRCLLAKPAPGGMWVARPAPSPRRC